MKAKVFALYFEFEKEGCKSASLVVKRCTSFPEATTRTTLKLSIVLRVPPERFDLVVFEPAP